MIPVHHSDLAKRTANIGKIIEISYRFGKIDLPNWSS
jgi:hypothetical protein